MRRYLSSVFSLAVAVAVTCGTVKCLAQTMPNSDLPPNTVILLQPGTTIYPPVARQAHITGVVELQVRVGHDGSVQSAELISGHPILQAAALASARESRFECRACSQSVVSSLLVYTFQLTPAADPCKTSESPTHTELAEPGRSSGSAQIHVGVTAEAITTCDPAVAIVRMRSMKCLYLWKCGTRYGL